MWGSFHIPDVNPIATSLTIIYLAIKMRMALNSGSLYGIVMATDAELLLRMNPRGE